MTAGQLALVLDEAELVAAAVWETLPLDVQLAAVRRLAELMAAMVEAERDE
jgi:hypothetical protein